MECEAPSRDRPFGGLLPDGVDADQGRDRDRHQPDEWPLAGGLLQLRAREDRSGSGASAGREGRGADRRLPTSFDDARQQIVYEVAFALLQPRVLPVGLYRRAVSLLGDKGLTDLTVLIGYFTSVSMTLMAYDVPSSAVGIER
jgi:hypothetical protein